MKKSTILLIIIMVCLILVGSIFLINRNSNSTKEYNNVVNEVISTSQETHLIKKETKLEDIITFDYEKMKKLNSEAVGYIYLADSNISYPIVKHSDNDYYLNHDYTGNYNANGAIFVEESLLYGMDEKNCILYGHNMKSGAMFSDLNNFSDEKYALSHQHFIVYNKNTPYLYKVISTFISEATDLNTYALGFNNDAEFVSWAESIIKRSDHKFEESVILENDSTITLSTCTSSGSKRRIVVLKKINNSATQNHQ